MSTRTITNRLVTMRDDAFERTKDGISFRIEKVDEKPRAGVARELHGVMTVPWYLNQLVCRTNDQKDKKRVGEGWGEEAKWIDVVGVCGGVFAE